MRAEQTVSEMVVESLARQAEALSEDTGCPFEVAFTAVLKTPAGRRLGELADSPYRHEKAAWWQMDLLADREARRPVHLRELEDTGARSSWIGRYMDWAEGKVRREKYHAFVRERFASLDG